MARQAKADTEAVRARTAARAYAIWESEGRPHGRDTEHWLRAENELRTKATPAKQFARKAAAKTPAAKKPASKRGNQR